MTVSVIVPVYNSEKYLTQCVDSILRQTHTALDIILVDDGSTDTSGQICDTYAATDSRIRTIHKTNGGLSSARNAGLDIAMGKYVTFVDSDDIIHPTTVATLLSLIGQNDVAVAQFFRGVECQWPDLSRHSTHYYSKDEAIEATLYQHGITNSACAKLYRIGLFDGLRFKDGLWYEDLDLFYKIYERTDLGIVGTTMPLYFYRTNPDSFINTFDSRRLDVLSVTDEIERHYSSNPRLLRAAIDRKFSANYNMFILTSQHGLKAEADKCWQTILQLRGAELTNHKVRAKNKLGAALSFLGRGTVMSVAKILSKDD